MKTTIIILASIALCGCAGDAGEDGTPGSSCSVLTEAGAVVIRCTDGTESTFASYTDEDAVTAMGAKVPDNPLNHDKYTDAEAVAAATTAGFVDATALQVVSDEVAEIRSCPVDMVDGGEFCIEIDERAPSTDIAQAARACRGDGRRLCTFEEWFYACADITGLNDMIGNFEGSANMYLSSGLVSLGSGGDSCGNVDAQGGSVAYRCCKSKL